MSLWATIVSVLQSMQAKTTSLLPVKANSYACFLPEPYNMSNMMCERLRENSSIHTILIWVLRLSFLVRDPHPKNGLSLHIEEYFYCYISMESSDSHEFGTASTNFFYLCPLSSYRGGFKGVSCFRGEKYKMYYGLQNQNYCLFNHNFFR